MLVNHDLNFVFTHAGKCAGIALSQWLIDHYGFSYYGDPDSVVDGTKIIERHRFTIPDDCQDYEIITCIRDPFERWESFYLYSCLEMGVNLPFEQFTRERLKWLPLQTLYTKQATYILRVDQLDTEVLNLPFVRHPVPEIPRMNVSEEQPGYDRVKQQIQWNDELRELVRQCFEMDFMI